MKKLLRECVACFIILILAVGFGWCTFFGTHPLMNIGGAIALMTLGAHLTNRRK